MTNEKLVSVIIPVYNAQNYLRECIESFLKQSYANIEIIMVDDGSTDNSAEIIREKSEQDNRIRYIYQENSGAPVARNNGLDHAQGDYIYLFDADDIVEADSIQVLLKFAEKENSDIVIGNFRILNADGSVVENAEFNGVKTYQPDELSECMLFSPLPGNKLFSAKLIKEKKIRFANVRLGQDLNFYQKVMSVSKYITVCPEVVMSYRIVGNSVSHSYTGKVVDIIKSMDDVAGFHQDNCVDEKIKEGLKLVRIKHYEAETSKVPKIKEKEIREQVMSCFREELEKIWLPKNKRNKVIIKKYYLFMLRTKCSAVFCTDAYCSFRENLRRVLKRK